MGDVDAADPDDASTETETEGESSGGLRRGDVRIRPWIRLARGMPHYVTAVKTAWG
jgi:hypothetical protein